MLLQPGDPAPHFKAATPSNPSYSFGTVAGRYVLLAFLPLADSGAVHALTLKALTLCRGLFDDERCCVFGVLRDPALIATAADDIPGIRWVLDTDGSVCAAHGALEADGSEAPGWLLLDPNLRVLLSAPYEAIDTVMAAVAALPPIDQHAGTTLHAPVLIVPRVFEPAFCRQLIDLYEADGGKRSGFMRDVEGRTVLLTDPGHKRRSDVMIEDERLQAAIRARMLRRLSPEITRAFQFTPTRIERYLVACYDAAEEGFFRPHRDNTTLGTAHRKFAVTLNLNTGEYEGGDLRFPEFGSRTYCAPLGGAVVFSCSLLHEATPVTAGRRFAFLPFLYDDAAAKIREENARFLALDGDPYRVKDT
jgi:predicted 2-oxoglutarate/Fe(II)-dependent dioxygenase YbiX/peroxiredoxin